MSVVYSSWKTTDHRSLMTSSVPVLGIVFLSTYIQCSYNTMIILCYNGYTTQAGWANAGKEK